MLVTTAMKGLSVYKGSPRAVNFVMKDIEPKSHIRNVDPTQVGTPLVFYSPALTSLNSVLKVEIAFADFPEEFLSFYQNLPRVPPAYLYFLLWPALLYLLPEKY